MTWLNDKFHLKRWRVIVAFGITPIPWIAEHGSPHFLFIFVWAFVVLGIAGTRE